MRWLPAILAILVHASVSAMLMLSILPKAEHPILPPEKTELPPRLWGFKTEAVDTLATELKEEKEALAAEQKELATAQARVAAERAELEKTREEIKAMREEIDQRVLSIEDDEMRNLKTLSQTYGGMDPAAAVTILREMDENMAVKILALLKSDKVSPILTAMSKAADKPGEDPMAKRAARMTDKLRLLKPVKKPA